MVVTELADELATENLGRAVARALPPGCVVYLQGDLGAGKTTLARGILRGLGHAGSVKSPTYTLVESYELADGSQLHHFDLYRMEDPEELEFLGIRDYLDGEARCLVEWPQRGAGVMKPANLALELQYRGDGRRAKLTALDPIGRKILDNLS